MENIMSRHEAPTLKTERLILRPFIKEDLPQFKLLLDNPGFEYWRKQLPQTEEFLDSQIAKYQSADVKKDGFCLGAFDKASGDVIGAVGVQKHDDLREPEVFYMVLAKHQRKGYATEMTKVIVEWSLREYEIPYIIGTTDVDNIASQRVLEKCGFTCESERKLLVHVLGRAGNFKYYRYFKSAWNEREN
jgi:RimJ/RimL family protein N-acetyltransferase